METSKNMIKKFLKIIKINSDMFTFPAFPADQEINTAGPAMFTIRLESAGKDYPDQKKE